MIRLVLAAAAALTLAAAAPAYACGADCPMHKTAAADCPMHAAAAGKAGKADAKVTCACAEGKACACDPAKCDCPQQKAPKAEKKS